MNKIVFAGANYDAGMLVQLAGMGYKAHVATQEISTLSAHAPSAVLVATQVNGRTHLLTGSLDPAKPMQELRIISKHTLKKALVQPTTMQERRDQSSPSAWRWQNDQRS